MKNWMDGMARRRWGAWNCAFYALVAVVGFITVNVAGCGGGGGGTPVPQNPTVTLRFRDLNNNPVSATGTFRGGRINATFTTANGDAVLTNIPRGVYTVNYTVNNVTGSQVIAVGSDSNQPFVIIPFQGAGSTVNGRIFLNRGDQTTGNCQNATAEQAVTARILIRVRRVADNVIIASFERPMQASTTPDDQKGRFQVILPNGAYRIEVRQASVGDTPTQAPAPITGNSALFNVPATNSITICANEGPIAPGGTPTATTTFTPVPTINPNATPTPTPIDQPLPTFTPTPTVRPTPTNTPGGPPPNPTFTPQPTFTPNPSGTATPTSIPGGGPTATPTGNPPPPPFVIGRGRR
jgi:hypothetical protein